MKAKKWINGNKMLFESDHQTFNKQCRCICTGNQIGDCVYSGFVRPYNRTKCNDFAFAKGHLQEYDLNWLLKDLPYFVKDWIRKYTKTKAIIAYHFFYRNNNNKVDIGYVVTDEDYHLIRKWYAGTYKAQTALDEAIKYITK